MLKPGLLVRPLAAIALLCSILWVWWLPERDVAAAFAPGDGADHGGRHVEPPSGTDSATAPAYPGVSPNPAPVRRLDPAAVSAAGGTPTATARSAAVAPAANPDAAPVRRPVAAPTGGNPNLSPAPRSTPPPPPCTGYGDQAFDQRLFPVDRWAPGIRTACGYGGYENGDDPMPPGTLFPPPQPFRAIDHHEPVFGFKVFYLGASTATPCDDLRIIFHQGDAPGGRAVRFHSMQYTVAHCDGAGNYLGYTDVSAYGDTGGVLDVNPASPSGDNGTRPMKLIPTLPGVQQYGVFEVWYVDFFIYGPGRGNTPVVTVRPGFDIHNVSTFQLTVSDTGLNFTCGVLGGGVPGDANCQYDGAKRGLSHPSVEVNNVGGAVEFCTDLYGRNPVAACDTAHPLRQHVFNGPRLYRTTCKADGGVGDPPDCYPEFVRGPNSPSNNKSHTPYESPGPATYGQPGLRYPN